jgi:tRNA1Val (adenine37-N6)-methyltransferase
MNSNDVCQDESETLEDLGRKHFRLIQKKSGFRYGEDTVLLAHFVSETASRKRRMLKASELGANCGAASILVAARRDDILIDGVEVQPEAARIFEKNIALNQLNARMRSVCFDIRHFDANGTSDMKRASYDLVFFNPPYYVPGRGPQPLMSESTRERIEARCEIAGTLIDFMKAAEWLLLPQGQVILVHRVSRLPEVLSCMEQCHLQPNCIRFVHVSSDKPATLFLIAGHKHGRPGGFRVMPPLILYREDHSYSDELRSIYDDGGS